MQRRRYGFGRIRRQLRVSCRSLVNQKGSGVAGPALTVYRLGEGANPEQEF